MPVSVWDSEREIGYEQKTTFWMDFSIADNFGLDAVRDTYSRAFKMWKGSVIYLTELVLVLNRKCWQWNDEGNAELSDLYSDLFYKTQAYAYETLKGDELDYFWRTTD